MTWALLSPELSSGILVTHWVLVVTLFIRVIVMRPPVAVSVAWLAVIGGAPFVGAAAYLLFGERRLGRARAARIAEGDGDWLRWQSVLASAACDQVDPAAEPIRRHAERVLGFPATGRNAIALLDAFEVVFDALVADIDAAARSCHLCFYIWDDAGRSVDIADALVRAAGRGVQCRVLVDAIGSRAFLTGPTAERLRAAGVELVAALATGPLRAFFVRRDLRNHRKIVVIDSAIAYTGSQNLVDPRYFKQDAGVGAWVDAVARVTGPTATALDAVFAMDWSVEAVRPCAPPSAPMSALAVADTADAVIQVVPSGPGRRPEAIHQLLLTAIYGARRELVMTTPYFVPDESLLTAIVSAALRGVDVTLIIPAHNDSLMVRYAGAAHLDELMDAGVRIQRFEGGLLHTKSLAIDGALSIFGSVNLDMRSLWLNFEISLFVYDRAFTERLRALQDDYLRSSSALNLTTWRQRPRSRRFVENAFRLFGPLL